MDTNTRKKFRDDHLGGMPGIVKIAIVAVIIYVIVAVAVPKFKQSQIDKDVANMQKLTTVLQGTFGNADVMNVVPHVKGGMEAEYSMKDIMYYGGGGSSNAFYDFVVEGVGDDFPDTLVTTKKDVKIKIIGNKNYLEIFLYAESSEKEENMLAHFYSPTTRGEVDPEGLKYKFYDAKD